jgi:hypothetical protein
MQSTIGADTNYLKRETLVSTRLSGRKCSEKRVDTGVCVFLSMKMGGRILIGVGRHWDSFQSVISRRETRERLQSTQRYSR